MSQRLALFTAAIVTLGLAGPPLAQAASLQPVANFGANPSGIKMYIYVPDKLAPSPPILVGVHWCHGTGLDFFNGVRYSTFADRYGFIIIIPSAVSSDGCWDVHSRASLTHDGGGDAGGIVSMVKYVEQTYNADPARVYVTGHSSGGMMTNVLLGSYPDVFKAGAASAGVPFSCFATNPDSLGWSADCATGKVTKTDQQWGDLVRAAYPGFMGPRPRMQLFHGTADAIVLFHNFGEEIKEWTNVLGISATPTSTENNTPMANWVRTRYSDRCGNVLLEAHAATGESHNLPILPDQVIRFFGLDGSPIPVLGSCNGGAGAGGQGGKGNGSGGAGGTTTSGGTGGAPRDGGAVDTGAGGMMPSGQTGGGDAGPTGTGGTAVATGGTTVDGSGGRPGTGGASAARGGAGPTSSGGAPASGTGGRDGGSPQTGNATAGCGCAAGGTPDGFRGLAPAALVILGCWLAAGGRRRRRLAKGAAPAAVAVTRRS